MSVRHEKVEASLVWNWAEYFLRPFSAHGQGKTLYNDYVKEAIKWFCLLRVCMANKAATCCRKSRAKIFALAGLLCQ